MGGMCWTITMPGRGGSKRVIIADSASVPPVDAPMAMRSIAAELADGVKKDSLREGAGLGIGGAVGLAACQVFRFKPASLTILRGAAVPDGLCTAKSVLTMVSKNGSKGWPMEGFFR